MFLSGRTVATARQAIGSYGLIIRSAVSPYHILTYAYVFLPNCLDSFQAEAKGVKGALSILLALQNKWSIHRLEFLLGVEASTEHTSLAWTYVV